MNRFLVQEKAELRSRGGILAGLITEGTLRSGQKATVRAPDDSEIELEIESIEFMDDISSGRSRIALMLSGGPSADFLHILVPNGTVLEFE